MDYKEVRGRKASFLNLIFDRWVTHSEQMMADIEYWGVNLDENDAADLIDIVQTFVTNLNDFARDEEELENALSQDGE